MGSDKAFTFVGEAGGDCVPVAEPLALATRLRTRARAVRVVALGREEGVRAALSLVEAGGRPLARSQAEWGWSEIDPVVIAPETTFYAVAHLRPGDRFRQGTTIASVSPELVDLGTWSGYPAWEPTAWRPSGGPRNYVANLRFEVCAVRRSSTRAVEILELAADGFTDKAIAARLGIGESTVEAHWRALRERKGYASRTEAVAAHLRALAERGREDLEAQRDEANARAWLRQHRPDDPALRGAASVRSWPGWPL